MKAQPIEELDSGEQSPQFRRLKENVETLLPIRKRKLISLKGELKKQEKQLKFLHREYRKGERRLETRRQFYLKAMEDFKAFHTGVILVQEKLHQGLQNEKHHRDRLLKQEKENEAIALEITEQEKRVDAAKREVNQCQADIDKLEYILEQRDFV